MGCGCLYSNDTKKLAEISSNQVKNRNVLLVKDLKEVTLYFHNSTNVRKNLAESLVIAKLDYASTVFYPLPQYQVDRLQRLQNACAGFVLRKYAGPEDLAYLNWLPISERRDFNILKLTHKAIHSSDFPEYLSLELHNVHTHNLRLSEAPLLLVPKETGTFQHSAASIFNKLPSPHQH